MSLKNILLLVLSVSLALGVMATAGCVAKETAAPKTLPQIIKDVTPQEAFTLIQNNKNNPGFVIIDVRTAEEFAEGHIENATNLDFYATTFRDDLNKLDKQKTYLIYCRSGRRSASALDTMAKLNFREVYNIADGIIAWVAAGLPTIK